MIIKTLDDLRQTDERTLRFTPMGLGLGVQMRPDDAAEYQQRIAAQFDLAPGVSEGTRRSFEHLRTVFAYGVLCYELYTLVNDHALSGRTIVERVRTFTLSRWTVETPR